jgi:hypothetical protein
MIDEINRMLTVVDLPNNLVRFYYEVYTANYRPDGDYGNIKPEEFKDYRQFVQRKTPNNTAYEYSSAKIPFIGSNVEGKWGVNNSNQWYYVVLSYKWYPIFLFINDQWYRVLDTYSNSTAKQMSASNPVHWNSGLKANVIDVSKGEIEGLMSGLYSIDRVKTDRISNFVRDKDRITNQSKLISGGWGNDAVRVNFMIKDVEDVDGKIKISVKVLKGGKMVDRKMIPDENFRDNPVLLNDIMKTIKWDILRSYPKYLTDDNTEIELIN